MKKVKKGFPDKPEYEDNHFSTYIAFKWLRFFNVIFEDKMSYKEVRSMLYPFYLEEKKQYWKHIQDMEIVSRNMVRKIIIKIYLDEKIKELKLNKEESLSLKLSNYFEFYKCLIENIKEKEK